MVSCRSEIIYYRNEYSDYKGSANTITENERMMLHPFSGINWRADGIERVPKTVHVTEDALMNSAFIGT